MARPESRLSAENTALHDFAKDLRKLRHAAGSPSYRTLAHQAHYSASSLSRAAGGQSLPSLEVTLAFVQACDGDINEWSRRWRETVAVMHGHASGGDPSHTATMPDDTRSAHRVPPRTGAADDLSAAQAGPNAPPARRRAGRWVLPAAVAVVAALGVSAALIPPMLASNPKREAKPRAAVTCPDRPNMDGGPQPVADCSDANRAGCSDRIVTLGEINVRLQPDLYAGRLELRYSAACRSGWARFTPDREWRPTPGTVMTTWTIRPADASSARFSQEFRALPIYTDMLLARPGCLVAEVQIRGDNATSPLFATPCLRGDTHTVGALRGLDMHIPRPEEIPYQASVIRVPARVNGSGHSAR